MDFTPGLWKVFGGTIELENKAMQVDHVDVDITVHDTTSRDDQNNEVPIYFTDLQFQPGYMKTGWIPNTQEFLDRIEFDVNEWKKYSNADGSHDTDYIWNSVTPKQYTASELGYKRMFNLMGRGHEVIALPNDLPEEKFWQLSTLSTYGYDRPVEILSTGIDFTLIPKDNYDLCRISTDVGSLLPEDQWIYKSKIDKYQERNPNGVSVFEEHPLNTRYTREFWFSGGLAGDILEVNATTMTSRKNGTVVERDGIRQITIGSDKVEIYKNKYHLMPRGSVRFRIEFYKMKPMEFVIGTDSTTGKDIYETMNVLTDTGIGFGGTAKFLQWTYGVERL